MAANRSASDIYFTAVHHEEMQQRNNRGQARTPPAHSLSFRDSSVPTTIAVSSDWSSPESQAKYSRMKATEAGANPSPFPSSTLCEHGAQRELGEGEESNIRVEDTPRKDEYVNTILLLRRELGKARKQAQ